MQRPDTNSLRMHSWPLSNCGSWASTGRRGRCLAKTTKTCEHWDLWDVVCWQQKQPFASVGICMSSPSWFWWPMAKSDTIWKIGNFYALIRPLRAVICTNCQLDHLTYVLENRFFSRNVSCKLAWLNFLIFSSLFTVLSFLTRSPFLIRKRDMANSATVRTLDSCLCAGAVLAFSGAGAACVNDAGMISAHTDIAHYDRLYIWHCMYCGSFGFP